MKFDLLYCGKLGIAASPELQAVVKNARGKLIPVTDWQKLRKELEEALGLYEYQLYSNDGKQVPPSGAAPIGTSVAVKDGFAPGRPLDYDVRIVDQEQIHAPIALEGGENVTLKLLPGGKKLEHEPYPRDRQSAPQFVMTPLALDADPTDFRVVPYRPEWQLERLHFPVSVQNKDPGRFSPRPREAWIEITPIDNGELASYPCYDLAFEPETPVPVLYCDVPKWPRGASRASIKLWFKLHSSVAMAGESGGARIADCDEYSRPIPVGHEWLEGTKFIVKTVLADKGCELIVEEQHLSSGPPEWARVQVETSESPDRIVREFDYEGKMARHHFHFGNRNRQQISNGTVWVTAQKAIKRDAAAVADPLEVDIPERARGT